MVLNDFKHTGAGESLKRLRTMMLSTGLGSP